mmetsp:Transcript_67434/g.149417  ORF Transcript_67434/g.149417 Transcript_67434/m.149417 type:complete len:157 (-) Transcript_67434:68-538(-)
MSICFVSAVCYCHEGAAVAEALVTTSENKKISCDFSTQDGSATAGASYEAASGKISIEPSEMKPIRVKLLSGDEELNAVSEFTIKLSGNQASPFMNSCLVKIIPSKFTSAEKAAPVSLLDGGCYKKAPAAHAELEAFTLTRPGGQPASMREYLHGR